MSKLVRTQALSGLLFSVFLVVHLLNTALAALGPQTYDGFQRAARAGYQFAPLEMLVLGALLVHVGCGVARMAQRRGQPKAPVSAETRAHRWSAYFLLTFFVGHIVATRGASFFYGVFPGSFETLAAMDIALHHLCTWWDVLDACRERPYFAESALAEVRRFLEDPVGWSGAHGGITSPAQARRGEE